MNIYTNDAINNVLDNVTYIVEKANKQRDLIMGPSKKELEEMKIEQNKIVDIIHDFLKQKKRKIYGGYALNLLLIRRNPKLAIYDDDVHPDIDFYSPDPLDDLISLCNILYDKGFSVEGREALHKETYKIYVNREDYVDISYVPKNIYNRLPFIEFKGLTLIHPSFMKIDYMRIFTDPIGSYQFKFEKRIDRFRTLDKQYPAIKYRESFNPQKISGNREIVKSLLDQVKTFLQGTNTTVTIGWHAYNYYAGVAKHNKIKPIELPFYQIISTDYVNDATNLYKEIIKNNPKLKDGISKREYYPFFQFYGYNMEIYYKKNKIVHIYHNYHRCVPYVVKNNIKIGTCDQTILMEMMFSVRARVVNDKNKSVQHLITVNNLVDLRTFYLKANKKSIIEKSPFQSFAAQCIGEIIDPFKEREEKIAQRKKERKPYIYQYKPEARRKTKADNWYFANSSGNLINNEKNLKINIDKLIL